MMYMKMHKVDAIVNFEWNSLITYKTKGCITDAAQEFVYATSLLARKWQDKIGSF
jgi:hypothetical protein